MHRFYVVDASVQASSQGIYLRGEILSNATSGAAAAAADAWAPLLLLPLRSQSNSCPDTCSKCLGRNHVWMSAFWLCFEAYCKYWFQSQKKGKKAITGRKKKRTQLLTEPNPFFLFSLSLSLCVALTARRRPICIIYSPSRAWSHSEKKNVME